jgi:hypothetical protein
MDGVGDKHALLVYLLIQGAPLVGSLDCGGFIDFFFMDTGVSLV